MALQDYRRHEEIQKGWSGDRKYRVTDRNGVSYLLRLSPLESEARKQSGFCMMQRVAALGVPMCEPVECGVTEAGVYWIQGWIDGHDAEVVLPSCSTEEQYRYGLEAGRILARIHTIPAPLTQEPWEVRFNRKVDRKINGYRACPMQYDNGKALIDFIESHRRLLSNRPQVYQHGDYHIGNMMIDRAGRLCIIDFDRDDYGDPWQEFNRIVWCVQAAPVFASGMVDGYFEGEIPSEFWALLAFYIASNTLSSLPWAVPFGEAEVRTMLRQEREVSEWYDNMTRTVPRWYDPLLWRLHQNKGDYNLE